MKLKILILTISVTFLNACQPSKEKQEPTASFFGDEISLQESQSVLAINQLMSQQDTASLKLEGTIVQTCARKGCWMTVDLGEGKLMRVTFKDYGFFVPKDSVSGKKVVFEGVAIKSVTPVEELRHYAEDAGSSEEEISKIIEAKEEYKFVAKGVAII